MNVGPGELLVILLVALIVLGPEKLPDTARKIGNVMGQLRRMSQGFQDEVRSAMDAVVPTTGAPAPTTPEPTTQPSELPPAAIPAPAAEFSDDVAPIDPTGGARPTIVPSPVTPPAVAQSDDPAA